MEERYFTIRQVANLLKVKVRTVREYIRDGKLKGVKDEKSHRWAIPESEIVAFEERKLCKQK